MKHIGLTFLKVKGGTTMKELIDKDKVVAEIEKLKAELHPDFYEYNYDAAKAELLEKIEAIINTLEVKEVDLEKEIQLWIEENTCGGYCSASIRDTAEHFFELKAQKGK